MLLFVLEVLARWCGVFTRKYSRSLKIQIAVQSPEAVTQAVKRWRHSLAEEAV